MIASQIRRTSSAENDLREAWLYIAEDSIDAQIKYWTGSIQRSVPSALPLKLLKLYAGCEWGVTKSDLIDSNVYITIRLERLVPLPMNTIHVKQKTMALTRDFKRSVAERVRRDPAFAEALFDEAVALFLSGDAAVARLVLRDLVNATLGFERLAEATQRPSKSLHRMLSPKGNPSMDNLATIFNVLRTQRYEHSLESLS